MLLRKDQSYISGRCIEQLNLCVHVNTLRLCPADGQVKGPSRSGPRRVRPIESSAMAPRGPHAFDPHGSWP